MENNNDYEDDFILDNDEDFLPMAPSDDNIQPDTISKLETEEEENIFNEENLEKLNQEPNENIKIDEKKENNYRKILYNNVKILPIMAFIFVFSLGIYIFINNVNADIINLIKIEEKTKIGYIDNQGNVVVKPKYLYGSDFYKGYAVVKNYNNLYGVIDGKGNTEISFGNIFSANLYGNRYIVSKFTNEGLKMGLLDSNLKEITRIKYDNLSYSKSGIFMYTYGDTMGIMNNDGKEIYSYKVDEVDDKNISVEVSNVDDKTTDRYAKIKINSSSTVINISTGQEVYKYTLDDIRVLDNNVFYVKNNKGNNKYFIIKNNNVVYQTDAYKRIRVDDINSDIAIAINEDASIDYINLLTKEKINQDGNVKYTYSDGVILQELYNFQNNQNEFTVITPKKKLSTFSNIKTVNNEYVNGFMKIITENDKYNYINKKGNILSNKEYEDVTDFNENGFAIVSNDNTYGVIDDSGKEIIDVKYDDIKFLDDTLFKNINKITNKQLFIINDNNKYGIINSDGKIVVKPIYEKFETITTKYPIIKAKYKDNYILVNLQSYKDLSIDSTNDVQVYEDYIVSNNQYYNYSGELIYTVGDN